MPLPPRLLPALLAVLPVLPLFAHHGGPGDIDEFARASFASGFLHPWMNPGHGLIALGAGLAFARLRRRGGALAALPLVALALYSALHSPNLGAALGLFAAQVLAAGLVAAALRLARPLPGVRV